MLRLLTATLAGAAAFAQSGDLCHRLQTVLAAPMDKLACVALAERHFAQVEQMLSAAKAASPGERSELLALRGAVEFLDSQPAAAAGDFQRAAALVTLTDADTFTYAMALVDLGQETNARPLLAALAERYPDKAIYIYWLGRLDYSQRRYDEAVEKLTRASQLDPQSARVWDSLGLAFDMQGRMDQALAAFEKAAQFNRVLTHPSPWPPHDLGFLLLRMDRLLDAETALRESLRYDPHFAQAHYHLGRTLEKQGRESEAIGEYRIAIDADPTSSDACYSLATLYRKLHRDQEASAMFAEYKKRRTGAEQP